ncbi:MULTISPECIES: HNH endonuclease [Mumia]|uniref:HNH endonuclease n=1 Tax=Mumia xiangluensis TaxID=1678900 RepID=A0ABW1QQH2_9ACTN|nr:MULTISPECIES: HNH endonuclease signature motif containing protein [Mumia]
MKPYEYKFGMELVSEPDEPVVTRWTDMQSTIGSGALASNGFITVKTDMGVSDLIVYFTGEGHGDDTPPLSELDIPANLDTRAWQTRAIAARRGQSAFRRQLLDAYGGACAITGTRVTDVLEAAHITPYRGQHTNDARNGLLLRSDVHTLFDLHRLTVLPTRQVRVAPAIGGEYAQLNNREIAVVVEQLGPDTGLLRRHNKACSWLR